MLVLFSVSNGKFHKPAHEPDNRKPWQPTATVCGITVNPQNFFASEEDANRHTGGRLSQFMCKHCARKGDENGRATANSKT